MVCFTVLIPYATSLKFIDLVSRAARSCWGSDRIKEMFCVDSSAAMNSLALAILQGGVWPSELNFTEDEYQPSTESHNQLLKGLFFRQFLPSSSAVLEKK